MHYILISIQSILTLIDFTLGIAHIFVASDIGAHKNGCCRSCADYGLTSYSRVRSRTPNYGRHRHSGPPMCVAPSGTSRSTCQC